MGNMLETGKNAPEVDNVLLAKNTLQIKLMQKMGVDDNDYDAITAFSDRYGEALRQLIANHPELAQQVMEKTSLDPDAPLDEETYSEINTRLQQYSNYLH